MASRSIAPSSPAAPLLAAALALWAIALSWAATQGWLAVAPNPVVPGIAVGSVVLFVIAYATSDGLRGWFARVGLRRMTLFHAWRIVAAGLFFYYGARGVLPPLLVRDGGVGDLLAGLFALIAVAQPFARWRYWGTHLFGAIDLVVALSTGVYLSTVDPVSMSAVRQLPFALIPMFGVPVTFAAHLVAFDLLRQGRRA